MFPTPAQNHGFLPFTIIGLFAFRLAKKLMEALAPYVGRDEDLVWIAEFLAN